MLASAKREEMAWADASDTLPITYTTSSEHQRIYSFATLISKA